MKRQFYRRELSGNEAQAWFLTAMLFLIAIAALLSVFLESGKKSLDQELGDSVIATESAAKK